MTIWPWIGAAAIWVGLVLFLWWLIVGDLDRRWRRDDARRQGDDARATYDPAIAEKSERFIGSVAPPGATVARLVPRNGNGTSREDQRKG